MAKRLKRRGTTKPPRSSALKLQRFPSVTEAFGEAMWTFIGQVARASDPFLARIAERGVPEGDVLVQHDVRGKRRIDMQEALTRISVPTRAVRETSIPELMEALVKAGRELAGQKAKMLVERLNQTTSETGRVFSGKGLPGFEAIMQAVEKTQIDFDSGEPNFAMMVGADLYDWLGKAIPEWEKDPVKTRRWHALMDRKRRAYLARERSRKLVD